MYHLIVSGAPDAWDKPYFQLEQSRFLEHTDAALRARFSDMSEAALNRLIEYPAVFAYETDRDKPARVGRIKAVRLRQGELRITFEFDSEIAPLSSRDLEEHAWEFDINKFEMNRTHWAIKDANLFEALNESGLNVEEVGRASVQLSRKTIISAASVLTELSHTEFDRMLLEFGIDGLDASRSVGSLQARANALAQFAIIHPEARTAEGALVGEAIVERAVSVA